MATKEEALACICAMLVNIHDHVYNTTRRSYEHDCICGSVPSLKNPQVHDYLLGWLLMAINNQIAKEREQAVATLAEEGLSKKYGFWD